MKKVKYTNRYNDVFTFSKTDDGNILFEGEFKWMRCGWPNVYDRAYPYPNKDIEKFVKWMYEQYGIAYPDKKSD